MYVSAAAFATSAGVPDVLPALTRRVPSHTTSENKSPKGRPAPHLTKFRLTWPSDERAQARGCTSTSNTTG